MDKRRRRKEKEAEEGGGKTLWKMRGWKKNRKELGERRKKRRRERAKKYNKNNFPTRNKALDKKAFILIYELSQFFVIINNKQKNRQ